MKLASAQFDGAVLSFATNDLLPAMGEGWKAWVMAGAVPLMMPVAHTMFMQFGVEDAEGVDIDKVETFITNAFKARPKVEFPLIGLGFDTTDGEKFLAALKCGHKPPQPTNNAPLYSR
jgi:hypothetical protein